MRKLNEKGNCLVSTRQSGQKDAVYDSKLLSISVDIFHNSIKSANLAKALGIPPHTVAAFNEEGLIKSIDDHDALLLAGEPIYERHSTERLIEKVDSLPITPTDVAPITLSTALLGKLNPYYWTCVVRALLNGDLKVRGRKDNCRTLSSVLIDGDELFKLIAEGPMPDISGAITISCASAEKVIGISNVTLSKAVNIGFIPALKTKFGSQISLTDLDAFISCFIFGSKASQKLGLTNKEFIRRMTANGFRYVAEIHRSWLWNRKDVEEVFPNFSIT